jgi:hypothetical protein
MKANEIMPIQLFKTGLTESYQDCIICRELLENIFIPGFSRPGESDTFPPQYRTITELLNPTKETTG